MAEAKKTVPVKMHYDFWAEEDVRTPAGTVIMLSVDDAKKVLAEGKGERADPLPGEG